MKQEHIYPILRTKQFKRKGRLPISPRCSKCAINKYCPKIGIKRSR